MNNVKLTAQIQYVNKGKRTDLPMTCASIYAGGQQVAIGMLMGAVTASQAIAEYLRRPWEFKKLGS